MYSQQLVIKLLKLIVVTVIFCSSLTCADWRWDPRSTIPIESHIRVHLFNVKNPLDAIAGKKVSVKEVGPFVYRETTERVNISLDAAKGTVKYQEKRTYEFVPDLSTGSENDVINFVNVPFGSALVPLMNVPMVGPNMIGTILKSGEKLVSQNLKVGDILYDGVNASVYTQIMISFDQVPPPQMEGGKFGLFRGRNGTADSEIEVDARPNYLHNLGDVVSWKGSKELKFWNTDNCNKIKGSDGTVFPPGVKKQDTLHFFNPEACRSLPLVFKEIITIGPVEAYRFTFPESMVEDARRHEANACYCRDYDDFDRELDKCLKRGAMDLGACRKGAPLVSTYPHFLGADPDYLNGVEGVSPDPILHSSYVDIEPITGTVVRSSLKFQLNIDTTQLKQISALGDLPEYLFPVMWIDKTYAMQETALEKLAADKDNPNILVEDAASGSNNNGDPNTGISLNVSGILILITLASSLRRLWTSILVI